MKPHHLSTLQHKYYRQVAYKRNAIPLYTKYTTSNFLVDIKLHAIYN